MRELALCPDATNGDVRSEPGLDTRAKARRLVIHMKER
jgi:hypothetical protein